MAHTILEFKDRYFRFTGDDLIVASILMLELNKEEIALHFPTMRDIWLEEFMPAFPFMTDLNLDTFVTTVELEHEFLKIIKNTYEHVESNTYNNKFSLSSIDHLIETAKLGVPRQYHVNLLLEAFEGLKSLFE